MFVSAGGGMLGLSSVKPGSDGQWTVTQISCHSGNFSCFCQHIILLQFSAVSSMSPSLCIKTNTLTLKDTVSSLKNESHEKCKCLCPEMKLTLDSCDPDLIFIFHLFSLLSPRSSDWYGLFSFWWESPGNMFWRWNGELLSAVFLSVFHLFLLSFFVLILPYPVVVCVHWSALPVLSGFVVPGKTLNAIWTFSFFVI